MWMCSIEIVRPVNVLQSSFLSACPAPDQRFCSGRSTTVCCCSAKTLCSTHTVTLSTVSHHTNTPSAYTHLHTHTHTHTHSEQLFAKATTGFSPRFTEPEVNNYNNFQYILHVNTPKINKITLFAGIYLFLLA